MGNDMLFKSGSSTLSDKGISAINNLGTTLAQNTGMDIMIVGHTDNTPFKNGSLNNWDLSVQRATSVVALLTTNKNIDPANLTAAGKGEKEPIADNATEAGRSKNRRIEIIISPKLEKLSEIIKN
jgi:chemotaxis protein MotB